MKSPMVEPAPEIATHGNIELSGVSRTKARLFFALTVFLRFVLFAATYLRAVAIALLQQSDIPYSGSFLEILFGGLFFPMGLSLLVYGKLPEPVGALLTFFASVGAYYGFVVLTLFGSITRRWLTLLAVYVIFVLLTLLTLHGCTVNKLSPPWL